MIGWNMKNFDRFSAAWSVQALSLCLIVPSHADEADASDLIKGMSDYLV